MDPGSKMAVDDDDVESGLDEGSQHDEPTSGISSVNVDDFGTIFSASAPFMDVSITRFYPLPSRMVYEVTTWV